MIYKEVGELWRKYSPWSGLHGIELQAAKDNIALIRLLVEERAAVHDHGDYSNDEQHQACRERALSDFGIDPKEFYEVSGALAPSDPAK